MKAYCANPLCVPNRTSIFTGRYPHEHGKQINSTKAIDAKEFPNIGMLLRKAGYTTGYFGKWHLPYPFKKATAETCHCTLGIEKLKSRDSSNNAVRRRKECLNCGRRFTTYEYIQAIELMVEKNDGRLERFDLNRIVRGLQKACEKRPVTMEQIHELSERVGPLLIGAH